MGIILEILILRSSGKSVGISSDDHRYLCQILNLVIHTIPEL